MNRRLDWVEEDRAAKAAAQYGQALRAGGIQPRRGLHELRLRISGRFCAGRVYCTRWVLGARRAAKAAAQYEQALRAISLQPRRGLHELRRRISGRFCVRRILCARRVYCTRWVLGARRAAKAAAQYEQALRAGSLQPRRGLHELRRRFSARRILCTRRLFPARQVVQ
jgi:hypothetical protein